MKYLSVAIPCYNSQDYMEKAINSVLVCKDDVEIIIVDDGSTDNTSKIGKEYEAKYPDCVRYVYQENGGHGQAVNTGIKEATGFYYKVLDSDDWFDEASLIKVVDTLKSLYKNGNTIDLMIANYVYDKPSAHKQSVIRYKNALPTDRIFRWYDVKHFYPQQNLLMHSLIYRTQLLRNSNIQLPKHTFYVDNLFAYEPLPYVNTLYYINVDLYHYYIGREDQSVNEKVMISRIDQQIAVNKRMIDCDIMSIKSRKLRTYMIKYLTMISVVSSVLLIKSGTEENLTKRDDLWAYMKAKSPELYKSVKHSMMGALMEVKSKPGREFVILAYNITQKIFAFN